MSNEEKIKVLLTEYTSTNQKIEQFIKSQSSHFFGGLGFVFGIFGIVKSLGGDALILSLLPSILLSYFGILLYHYQRTYALQGYKRYLEDKINEGQEEKLIFYGELGMEFMEKKNRIVTFNFLSNTLLFIVSIFISFRFGDLIYSFQCISADRMLLAIIGVITILQIFLLLRGALRLKGTYIGVYEYSKKQNKKVLLFEERFEKDIIG